MKLFPVSIITPYGNIFNDEVVSIVAPGQEGFLGVMANHASMFTLIKEGVLEIKTKDSHRIFYAVSSGILEVNQQGQALMLIDSAVSIDKKDIDQKQLSDLIAR